VRVEFLREENGSERVVAGASWTEHGVEPSAQGEEGRAAIERMFRPAPIAIDDPSLRSYGTQGEVTLQPGSLRWFMAAARTRGEAEGLKVRFVADGAGSAGWDPAGAYRTFTSNTERLDTPRRTPVSSADSSRRPA
jgi:hypothetical protein